VSFLSQKLDGLREGSLLLEGAQKDSASSASAAPADVPYDFKHRRSSSRWNEELSPSGSTITESTQAGELISGSKLPTVSCARSCFISLFCYLCST
jgi:centromeric protein E